MQNSICSKTFRKTTKKKCLLLIAAHWPLSGHFSSLLEALGGLLGPLEGLLDAFWRLLEPLGSLLGASWRPLVSPYSCPGLGGFWGLAGLSCAELMGSTQNFEFRLGFIGKTPRCAANCCVKNDPRRLNSTLLTSTHLNSPQLWGGASLLVSPFSSTGLGVN